jgi:hypothetical protein
MSVKVRGLGGAILLVGLWGALVPFVGPTFGYQMGGVAAWTWSESHLTVHLIPGAVAVLGGALMLGSARSRVRLGALLAVLAGTWFIIGPSIRPLWAGGGGMSMSMSMGESVWSQIATALGYHYGTGVLIAVLAAYSLGLLVQTGAAPRSRPLAEGSPTAHTRERAAVS